MSKILSTNISGSAQCSPTPRVALLVACQSLSSFSTLFHFLSLCQTPLPTPTHRQYMNFFLPLFSNKEMHSRTSHFGALSTDPSCLVHCLFVGCLMPKILFVYLSVCLPLPGWLSVSSCGCLCLARLHDWITHNNSEHAKR